MTTVNAMILGQSGVGKSSLLNYLFNKELVKTGVGKPVTKKGEFHNFSININGILYSIYDSWGLEADKSGEWRKLIIDKINSPSNSPAKSYLNKIHCVVYCISYTSSRIQDYDKEILQFLKKNGIKVIVACTHSDDKMYQEKSDNFHQILLESGAEKVIDTCIGCKPKIGQTKGNDAFGKGELFWMMQNEVSRVIIDLGFKLWKKESDNIIEILYSKSRENIDRIDDIGFFESKPKQVSRIREMIEKDTNSAISEIYQCFNAFKEDWEKFESKSFSVSNTINILDIMKGNNGNLSDGDSTSIFAYYFVKGIPIIGQIFDFISSDIFKEEIRGNVDNMNSNLHQRFEKLHDRTKEEVQRAIGNRVLRLN